MTNYQHLLANPLDGSELKTLIKIGPHVDCLLPQSSLALSHLSNQWKMLSAKLSRDISEDEALLKLPNLHTFTQERVSKNLQAHKKFSQQLQALFHHLPSDQTKAAPFHDKALEGLGHTLPLVQPLIGHPKNIFRDWVWGHKENEFYLNLVKNRVQGEKKNILVIASGASRLAYDLHHTLNADFTFALDNSYFFAKAFEKICWGGGMELTEFPAPSFGDDHLAHTHTILAPHPSCEGLVFHLGDLNYLPYKEQSFDLIVTPWIIDLIPQTLPFLISNISSLLKPQGQWINFGPYSLTADIPSACRWSQKEVRGFIEEVGLENFKEAWESVEYLKSPYSSLTRLERMWTFSCTQNESQAHPLIRPTLKEPWLINHDLSIPKTAKVEASLVSHRVPASVFELIDGKTSLKELASILAVEFKMTEGEAQQAITQFLTRWTQS